jgi:hypothetical protein
MSPYYFTGHDACKSRMLEIMIRIIVTLAKVLFIYHPCGFSSDILKSHELLTICNLIYNTRVKETETISTSWKQHFAEMVVSSRVFCVPQYLLMYYFTIKIRIYFVIPHMLKQ